MTNTLVTRSRDRAWGATVFAGRRVPVEMLFDYLEVAKRRVAKEAATA